MKIRFTKNLSIILLTCVLLLSRSQAVLEAQNPTPFLSSPYYGAEILTRGFISGHSGQDYALNYEPVLAAADGTVHLVAWYTDKHNHLAEEECYRYTELTFNPTALECSYGLYIYINHDNGYQTRYAHLSAVTVSKDDRVTRGQVIGTSGTTGWSTGPHLHFEVRDSNNNAIDPDTLWIDGERANPSRPIPAPPRGRVITIDDGEAAFVKGRTGGPTIYTCPPNVCRKWWLNTNTPLGYDNDYYYTDSSSTIWTNYWATWTPLINAKTQGWYEVQVYLPNTNDATSWYAPYRLSSANSTTARLDQYGSQGRWVSLGVHHLTPDEAEVQLTNLSGESENEHCKESIGGPSEQNYCRLAADAVRFTHLATYLPDVRSAHQGWDTALHIRNDGAGPTDIVITLFNPNGTHFHRDVIANVQPRARLYYNPTQNNWRGSIIVSAREAVSVLVAHQHLHPYKVGAYTGVTAPTPRGHVSLLLRNVYGLNSTLALLNTGDTETRLTVRFSPRQKENGNPEGQAYTTTYTVQASGVQNINLNDLTDLGDLFVGSAYITNSANHPLAIASTQESAKTLNAMSHLYSGNILYAPLVQYGQPGSWDIFSSASVQNTSDSPGQISTYYYNVDGSQCTANPWLNTNIKAHQMVNIIPLPPDGNGCQNSVVAAKIIGGAQTWTAWVNQRENFATSTYEAVGQGSRAISIPYWHNTGTWDTGLSLQNLANVATTVTIVFYNPDGTEHSTHTVSLEPEGRFTYGWDEPDQDFSGSAFVTANNPIAAVVNVLDYHYKEREVDSLISYTPIHYYLD